MPRNSSTNSRLHRRPTHVVRTRSLKQRYYLVFRATVPELTFNYSFPGPCTMPDRHQTIGLYRVKMTGSSRRIHWTCSWRRLVLYLLDSRRKTRDPGDRRYYPGVRRGWNARGYFREEVGVAIQAYFLPAIYDLRVSPGPHRPGVGFSESATRFISPRSEVPGIPIQI